MAFVLDQLKPNQKYFEAICGIPHPSTEEKAVSDYVCSVAEKLGLNYEQDNFGMSSCASRLLKGTKTRLS